MNSQPGKLPCAFTDQIPHGMIAIMTGATKASPPPAQVAVGPQVPAATQGRALSVVIAQSPPVGQPIAVQAAVVTGAGVIVAALIAFVVSRRTLYVTAVTTERSKWINALRTNLSTLTGRVLAMQDRSRGDANYVRGADYWSDLDQIARIISKVTLQLNPRGAIDANLLKLLDALPGLIDGKHASRIRDANSLLVRHAQWLLKEEWEVVKAEARIFSLLSHRARRTREKCYRTFCHLPENDIDAFLADPRSLASSKTPSPTS